MNKNIVPPSPLYYHNDELILNGFPIKNAIKEHKTPFYLYSLKQLKQNFENFQDTLARFNLQNSLICYAVKSNSNDQVLSLLASLGAGADIVSIGEFHQAIKAKIPAEKIVFSGVGKTDEEIEEVLDHKNSIFSFNVESADELYSIFEISKKKNKKPTIAFRLNPGVNAQTHRHISTGGKSHKFGIEANEIRSILKEKIWSQLNLKGLSVHIGSQLTDMTATKEAIIELSEISSEINTPIEYLDIGGGLGIKYGPEDDGLASLERYISDIKSTLEKYWKHHSFPQLVFEPGRIISGNCGVLVTKIIRTKNQQNTSFLITDAGMNDLIRPALYDAYHEILPLTKNIGSASPYDIVGPICETGDFFARNRFISPVAKNDFLIIENAGAYGRVMSSTYNSRELTNEIIICADNSRLL